MLMNAFQGGPIFQIFSPQGSKPLDQLRTVGNVQKDYDKSCRSQIVIMSGTGAKIRAPKTLKGPGSPGLFVQPILGLQLLVPHASALNLEVVLVDSLGSRRIFFSSSFTAEEIHPQHVKIPTFNFPRDIWVDLLLDMRRIHSRLYETRAPVGYKGIESVEIAGSLRLRKMYTMRELGEGSPDEIPAVFAFPPELPSACVVMERGDEMLPVVAPSPAGLPRVPSGQLSAGRRNSTPGTATPPSSRTGKTKSAAGVVVRRTPEGRPSEAAAPGGGASAKKRHLDAMLAMQQQPGTAGEFVYDWGFVPNEAGMMIDGPQQLASTAKPTNVPAAQDAQTAQGQRQTTVYTASQIEQLLLMRKRMLVRQQQAAQVQHQQRQQHMFHEQEVETGGRGGGVVTSSSGCIPAATAETLPDMMSSYRDADAAVLAATVASSSGHPLRPSLLGSTRGLLGSSGMHHHQSRLPLEHHQDVDKEGVGYHPHISQPATMEGGGVAAVIEMNASDVDEGDFPHHSIVSVHEQLQPPSDDDDETDALEDGGRDGDNDSDHGGFVVQHNTNQLQQRGVAPPSASFAGGGESVAARLIPSVDFAAAVEQYQQQQPSAGHYYGAHDSSALDDDNESDAGGVGEGGGGGDPLDMTGMTDNGGGGGGTCGEPESSMMRRAMENAARQLVMSEASSSSMMMMMTRGGSYEQAAAAALFGPPPVVRMLSATPTGASTTTANQANLLQSPNFKHDNNNNRASSKVERSIQPSVRDSQRSCIFYRVRGDSLPRYNTESDDGDDEEALSNVAVAPPAGSSNDELDGDQQQRGGSGDQQDLSISPEVHKLVLSELDTSPLEPSRLSDPTRYEYDHVVGCFFDKVSCRFVRIANNADMHPHHGGGGGGEGSERRGDSAQSTGIRPTSTKLF